MRACPSLPSAKPTHRNQSRAPFLPSIFPPHPPGWNARAPRAATRCELSAPSSPFPSLPPVPRPTRTPSRLFTDARSSRSARSPANRVIAIDRSVCRILLPLPPFLASSMSAHAIALPLERERSPNLSHNWVRGNEPPDSDVPRRHAPPPPPPALASPSHARAHAPLPA